MDRKTLRNGYNDWHLRSKVKFEGGSSLFESWWLVCPGVTAASLPPHIRAGLRKHWPAVLSMEWPASFFSFSFFF